MAQKIVESKAYPLKELFMNEFDNMVKLLINIKLSSKSKAEFEFFKLYFRGHLAEDQQYFEQNILAQTLNEKKYKNNPEFLRFKETSGLPFKSYTHFKRAAVTERAELYKSILLWNWS